MRSARPGSAAPGPRRRPGSVRRLAGLAAVVPLALLASGCASVFGSHATGPGGIALHDHELRSLLSQGRHDSALARVTPDRSKAGDELLRLQNRVLVAHHAGRPAQGAEALEEAVVLADDRYTRSVSRALFSALTNDRVLPYRPPPTERLLLHYYGALVHLRMQGPSGAAVEARRLEHRLQMAEDEGEPTGARRDLHVALHRFAAAIFEAAGDGNAAGVSRRRAERLEATFGPVDSAPVPKTAVDSGPAVNPGGDSGPVVNPVADSAPGPTSSPTDGGAATDPRSGGGPAHGEVLLAVEQGFVAHRVERSLNVPVWPDEMKRLSGERDSAAGKGAADEEARYGAALSVAKRALATDGEASGGEDEASGSPPAVPAAADPRDCGARVVPGVGRVVTPCAGGRSRPAGERARRAPEGTPRLLRVAWPEYRTTSDPAPVRVVASGATPGATRPPKGVEPTGAWSADVSAAVVEEFGERAPEILAKALLRAVVKNAVADAVEDEVEEDDEALGEVAGAALNVLGALTERADTRSWSLLPARIRLLRLRLPAGEHRLRVVAAPGGPPLPGRPAETVEVRVPAGGVAVASVRLWR